MLKKSVAKKAITLILATSMLTSNYGRIYASNGKNLEKMCQSSQTFSLIVKDGNFLPLVRAIDVDDAYLLDLLYDGKEKIRCDLNIAGKMIDIELTPFHYSIAVGSIKCFELLQRQGFDPSKTVSAPIVDVEFNAITLAIAFGQNDILEKLIENKLDLTKIPEVWSIVALKSQNKNLAKMLKKIKKGKVFPEMEKCLNAGLKGAAAINNIDAAKMLVKKGAEFNFKDSKTPLHISIENNSLDVAKFLISKCESLTELDEDGNTPLDLIVKNKSLDLVNFIISKDKNIIDLFYAAVKQNDLAVIKILLSKKVEINVKDQDGKTATHIAAEKGYLSVLRFLISQGANDEATDNQGQTPLHLAAKNNRFSVVKFLIKQGNHFDCKDCCGCTPLDRAIENDSLESFMIIFVNVGLYKNIEVTADPITSMIKKAVDFNSINILNHLLCSYPDKLNGIINKQNSDGETFIHTAAINNNADIIELLIASGADANVKDIDEVTPLHLTAVYNSIEAAKALIKNGAIINAEDGQEESPLHLSAMHNKVEITNYLAANGANVDSKNPEGETPLHYAAVYNSLGAAKALIHRCTGICESEGKPVYFFGKGAEVDAKSNVGRSPLHLAAQKNNLAVAKFLIEKGANLNLQDENQETPLHLTAKNNCLDVADYMIKKGADIKARNVYGKTALDLAASSEFKDLLKKYITEKESYLEEESNE